MLLSAEEQTFGKYQLLERIAAGGMAEIYRARYTPAAGITKSVCIKKILPHYAGNQSFVAMFVNEAKIAVGLAHGNIAQIFDFGEINGEFFLAMEYVHGQPVSKVLKRAREHGIPAMPQTFAAYIAIETLKGLHYAHTRLDEKNEPLGIIHRDVSPQNIILSYEGQVKIVDFGIAKARLAGRVNTEAGAVKGKYAYFSPEQARGKPVDARTDVFSMGIVLYEMLCGRLPFQGKMIEALSKLVKGDCPMPRLLNPNIAPKLERIVMKAMAVDREKRYESSQALQEALTAWLYAHDATVAASSLTDMMTLLYKPEIEAEGVSRQPSKAFLEKLPSYQVKLPYSATDSDSEHTAWVGASSGDSVYTNADTHAFLPATDPGVRGSSRWIWALPILTAALSAAGVAFVLSNGTFQVQVTSSPPGATLVLDGQQVETRTPLAISELRASQTHEVRLMLPGYSPWVQQLQGERGAHLNVHAVLEPLAPAAQPAAPVQMKTETPQQATTSPSTSQ